MPAEQPLEEGARQRRRMDPRGGLKTNVKRSISRACHFERSERSLSFEAQGLTFSHMCRALLRFSQLSFMPLEPYPARYARHLPHGGKAYDTGYAFLSFVFMPARVLLLLAIPQSRFPVCKEDFSLRSK